MRSGRPTHAAVVLGIRVEPKTLAISHAARLGCDVEKSVVAGRASAPSPARAFLAALVAFLALRVRGIIVASGGAGRA